MDHEEETTVANPNSVVRITLDEDMEVLDMIRRYKEEA